MEDLWKLKDMQYRLTDIAKKAEYDLLVKRFRQEEENTNMKNLLFDQAHFSRDKDEDH